MSFVPFTLQTLVNDIALDDSQQLNPQNQGNAGNRLGSRIANGIGWGNNKDSKVTVESVEAWENNLYLGTSDGQFLHYLYDQISSEDVYTTLSFYSLPEMNLLPPQSFPPIKGVTCYCYDISREGKTDSDGVVRFCAIKRRMICIYSLGDWLSEEMQIPLPDGAITACQYGPYVFAADHNQYKMINLHEKRMIPIQQYTNGSSGSSSELIKHFKPIITIISENEFLLALPSYSGQFMSFGCEPQLVQHVPLTPQTKTISAGPGIKVRISDLMDRLKLVNVFSEINNDGEQSSQSGGDIENDQSSLFSNVPTRLILAGSESIMALVTTPLVVQVDTILDSNHVERVEEALDSANQAISTAIPENVHSKRMHHEFNYIHQKSGLIYFGATYFDPAFGLFEKGKIDPRILIRLFTDLKDIVCEDEPVYIYSGVKTIFDRLGISKSLEKIYDPQMVPDLNNNPAAQELRQTLFSNSKEMIQKFLMKDREQRRTTGRALSKKDKAILRVRAVDNSLLRLYIESNSDDLLTSLLESDNECILDLCEKPLKDAKKIYHLALLYKEKKEYAKALEVWHSIIEQENPENDLADGLHHIVELLGKCDDPDLLWKYAKWVIQKDEIMGAKIFTQMDPKKPMIVEPSIVLSELRSVGKSGLRIFLEYLVTPRKSQEESYHTELALLYIQEIMKELLNEEIRLKFEETNNQFMWSSETSGLTYLTFLNQHADDSLSNARAKFIIFLQTSNKFNAEEILVKLKEAEILKAELAVVYGKLGQHENALHVLIHDLKDYRGAEIYCLNAGRIIGIARKTSKKHVEKKIADEKTLISSRKDLFLTLLKVYLNIYKDTGELLEKIIHLLNTQAVYMDITVVLNLLPESWSVELLNEFLVRSLRQTYHEYREDQILKGLCLGEKVMIEIELHKTYQEIGPSCITQNVTCSLCSRHISGSSFKKLLNNDIVHENCNIDQNENIDSG
ncbi:27943_t:CDS:10 [Dentiscutata erythropus]|uniref:27943_t:CDS:1 n=1 Tax=Dentiscutata erythropus TaxID=1348616 RepID=A0A9N8W273_9GLOM|nr:27943_t:CDS:10 [Dentiscutata erythropus]